MPSLAPLLFFPTCWKSRPPCLQSRPSCLKLTPTCHKPKFILRFPAGRYNSAGRSLFQTGLSRFQAGRKTTKFVLASALKATANSDLQPRSKSCQRPLLEKKTFEVDTLFKTSYIFYSISWKQHPLGFLLKISTNNFKTLLLSFLSYA